LIREAPIGSSPLAHARFLHGTGQGNVTVARKTNLAPPGDWQQHSYPVEKLYEKLSSYSGLSNVYISQNRFYGSRRSNRIAELSALFTDLDYYNAPDLSWMHPLGVLDLALENLQRARIPRPSLAIATGRGIALVWRHQPVLGYVLPKWNRCQKEIYEALDDLGADPWALDAARVLRLVGTYNSKSGAIVESIFEDLDYVWDFGDLADEILPLPQKEYEERRAQWSTRVTRTAPEREENPSKGFSSNGFSSRTLHQARLDDLQRLVRLRGLDRLPPGQRDLWMFPAAVSLSYLEEPQAFEKKVIELGRDYAGWSEAETRSRMHTVLSRRQAAADGETAEGLGQPVDPRYRISNQKIMAMLKITPDEEVHLKTIISKDTKLQRDRERKEQERRAAGVRPRDEYIDEARELRQQRRQAAKSLRGEGMSLRKIATELGVSPTEVSRLLNANSPNEDLNDLN
jgi:hypothetical protein